MTKFRSDTTKGGHKILSLHGPNAEGRFFGTVESEDALSNCVWTRHGMEVESDEDFDLIPLDEPKPEPSDTTELWNYVHSLGSTVMALEARIKDVQQDTIARVNGLRNDYLADKDAVSPVRVDALEERVEDANETAAFANQKVVAWTDRVEALEERLEALEQGLDSIKPRGQPTDIYAAGKGVWVTRQTLIRAFWEFPDNGHSTEEVALIERVAKRLGLEE
jgi:uncharacterized coiled-coil protein SlyX